MSPDAAASTEPVLIMTEAETIPISTQPVEELPAKKPRLKRQSAQISGEETFERRSPRTIVPVYISNVEEAMALAITKTHARQFNGIDYVSFPSPIHINLGDCVCSTSTNTYDKILMVVKCPDTLVAVESVVEAVANAGTGPEYMYCVMQLVGDAYRFKWNPRGNKASMFIRHEAEQKVPKAGDEGALVLEISGYYFNKSTKFSGATARVVSFTKK